MRHIGLVSIVAGAALVGCGSPTRDITGHIQSQGAAIVVAQSSTGRIWASTVTASGNFRLTVPTGARYRLGIAQRLGSGFQMTQHILWSTASGVHRWALVGSGGRLSLGVVSPLSASLSANAQGNSDDQGEDEDGPDDDVADGDRCGSGIIRDSDGDDDGDRDGEQQSSDGLSSTTQGCSSANDDGTSVDVEKDGNIQTDDGQEGDDDGDSLVCSGSDGGSSGSGGGGGVDAGGGANGGSQDAGGSGGGSDGGFL